MGFDCFFVGRLRDTRGSIWQLTACGTYSSYRWTELVICRGRNPTTPQTSTHAGRVAQEPAAAGWRLERGLTGNGNEFCGRAFAWILERLGADHTTIRAGRPQTNGHVERLHRTILEECWRAGLARPTSSTVPARWDR